MKKQLLLVFTLCSFYSHAQVDIIATTLNADGGNFFRIYTDNELSGTLTSIDIQATLTGSVNNTNGNDLTVYVSQTNTININGVLQAGGSTNFSANERIFWATGDSNVVPVNLTDSQTLATPIDFSANPTYNVWIGNGYADASNTGVWENITITLYGVSENSISISEVVSDAFSIFPNPVNNVISISNGTGLKINKVGITDINGRSIKTIILGNSVGKSQIDVSELNAGVYLLLIDSDKGTGVKKFIKN
ncbi:T9SS type A sorting domain-containing protein [Bizionia arctica]|uniref:Secretion system C-terminal sorting domain-containing protein n=1 Tax=Bizionia arctica TaxID=1495645 RepID=A0A917GJW6_9FLAO|nr:T9SS type A sorting domain-containing protein [Bizionia arctica]GGG48277.1 hypothetical protein GCM10010976_19560 [Bizionia arctica]